MANGNHVSYKRIGFTVIIGCAAIVGTLIYLGGMRGRSDEFFAETYYERPVSGLSVGSVVNFRGVRVGEVREISFVGNKYDVTVKSDNPRIYILMALNASAFGRGPDDIEELEATILRLVRDRGLRATVATSGITGISRVEVDITKPEDLTEVHPITWTPRHPYIPPRFSLLENFSVAATKVMNQINRMDLATAWSNFNHSVESVARIADGSKSMLEARQGDIERFVDNMAAMSADLRALLAELRQNPSLLVRERTPERLEETE